MLVGRGIMGPGGGSNVQISLFQLILNSRKEKEWEEKKEKEKIPHMCESIGN